MPFGGVLRLSFANDRRAFRFVGALLKFTALRFNNNRSIFNCLLILNSSQFWLGYVCGAGVFFIRHNVTNSFNHLYINRLNVTYCKILSVTFVFYPSQRHIKNATPCSQAT